MKKLAFPTSLLVAAFVAACSDGADDSIIVDARAPESGSIDAAVTADSGAAVDGAAPTDGGTPVPELPIVCTTQCRYVRAGAPAPGTGGDWSTAFPTLPPVLQRGLVYFVAQGSYGNYAFDDAPSGTQVITIKRATEKDHGTDVGWMTAYGQGQASWKGPLTFSSSYWVFDGSVRNEADWFDGAAYGFRIDHDNKDQNIIISKYGTSLTSIAIRQVFVDAIYGNLPQTTIRRYAIDTDGFDGGTTATNLLFHRMYVRGSNNVWFLRTTKGAIVEYSASEGVAGNGGNHGEIVNLYYSGNDAIIRYNHWKNAYLTGGATALVAITQADGLQFYGNVLSNFHVGDGAVGFDGYSSSHNRVYGNTFVQGFGNCGTAWGSGTDNLVRNNVYVQCPTTNIAGTHDYNAFGDSNARGEANAQLNVPTSIFANFGGGDFTLVAPTKVGQLLPAPFDVDMLGRVRGKDGTWDRGAYEYP